MIRPRLFELGVDMTHGNGHGHSHNHSYIHGPGPGHVIGMGIVTSSFPPFFASCIPLLGHVGEAARTPTIGKPSGAGGAGGQGQAGHKPWQSARGPAPTRSTWRRFSSTRASLLLSV